MSSITATFQTGDGVEQAVIPDAGATPDAYFEAFNEAASLLAKTVSHSAPHERAVFVCPPEDCKGLLIEAASFVDVPVPAQLMADFGRGCVPLLMISVDETGLGPTAKWQPPHNMDPAVANALAVLMDAGAGVVPPNTVRLQSTFTQRVYVRGLLFFPKRHNSSAIARLT